MRKDWEGRESVPTVFGPIVQNLFHECDIFFLLTGLVVFDEFSIGHGREEW